MEWKIENKGREEGGRGLGASSHHKCYWIKQQLRRWFHYRFQTGQPRFHYRKFRILLVLNFWDHSPEVKVQTTLQVPITSQFHAFLNCIICGFNISGQFHIYLSQIDYVQLACIYTRDRRNKTSTWVL